MHSQLPNFFESNLKILKRNHPSVYKQMTENPPEPMGTIVVGANGKPNLQVINSDGESILLHDASVPEKESADFLNKIPEDHKGFVGILGTGLGYGALDIPPNRKQMQRLAIFELEPGIFIQALKYVNLAPVLSDPRVILCIGQTFPIPTALSSATKTLQLENANLYYHQPSFRFNLNGYEQLKDDVFAHINSLNVGGQTTLSLGKDFVNNRFKHVCTIHHHLLLEQIQNKFSDVPAILVAGGPSLDKNIHLLKQAQESALIIAVDTVLPVLLKNGVHPHFLTCIDPNNLTFEKFADVLPMVRDTALICASWVNLKTPKIFPAEQIFWTFTSKAIEAWINTLLGGRMLTGGSSTVAHLNLIAAHILGCEPVIFIGQDLAYPNNGTTHVKGTVLHASAPTGTIQRNNNQSQMVMGIDGKLVRTDRSFLSMKNHFESFIEKSDITHINATEGGAHIEGTQVMTLQAVIERYCHASVDITKRLKGYNNTLDPLKYERLDSEFDKMIGKIARMESAIQKADRLSSRLIADLKNPKKINPKMTSFAMLPPKKQKQIKEVDKYNQQLDSAVDIWQLLEEITMEGLKQSERQKQEISLLAEDAPKYRMWLIKNLERFLDINKIRKETLALFKTNLEMVTAFHRKEAEYAKANDWKGLAQLYSDSGNFYLAKPILEQYIDQAEPSAEIYFLLGCAATHASEHDTSKQYFEKAINLDPDIQSRVDAFRQALGDEFMKFVNYFKKQPGRKASELYNIKKGLTLCPTHNQLQKELEHALEEDITTISSAMASKNHDLATPLVEQWYQTLTEQRQLKDKLPDLLTGSVFLYHGTLMIMRKKHAQGLSDLKIALQYRPKDVGVHQMLIETLFETGDFTEAIEALKIAIGVDKAFAVYWENIGDTLEAGGQHGDAIVAYENCFIHLPENIALLRKIGECYLAVDQLEAAKAALEEYKAKLEQMTPGLENTQKASDSND